MTGSTDLAPHRSDEPWPSQNAAIDPALRPTGIICGNDLIGLGILNALVAANIRVPDGVALIGYDDIAYAATATTP